MKRFVPVVAVLGVLALGAGCGGTEPAAVAPPSSSSQAASTPPSTAPVTASPVELEAAVRAYSTAYLGGQGDNAYELLSQRCKERMTRIQFVQTVNLASQQYGPQDIESLKVDQVAGDLGRVTYTYAKAELDQRGEPWVRESGAWRIDDC